MSQLTVWTAVREYGNEKTSLIDVLFKRFLALYTSKWTSQFNGIDDVENWKSVWVESFIEDKITPEMIKPALAKCRKEYDWPPTYSQFSKLCLMGGIDDIDEFYREIVKQCELRKSGRDKWASKLHFWAYQRIGEYDLLNCPGDVIKSRLKPIIRELSSKKLDEIPVPRHLMIENDGSDFMSKDELRAKIAELRIQLNRKSSCVEVAGFHNSNSLLLDVVRDLVL